MNQESMLKAMAGQGADFREARDRHRFHGPMDCAAGGIPGASELIEHFSFRSEGETMALLNNLQ